MTRRRQHELSDVSPGEEDLHGRLKLYLDETWMREKEETAKAASVDPPIHNETTIPAP